MLGPKRTSGQRSSSRTPEAPRETPTTTPLEESATKGKSAMSSWAEPSLAAEPSYRDHGGSPYGVMEYMQPLGELPNAKVRARVKPEGGRKSALGKGGAGGDVSAQDTPEGTPAPPHASTSTQPLVTVDDERDGDYAPKAHGKKKERAPRTRAIQRRSESTPTTAGAASTKIKPPKVTKPAAKNYAVNNNKHYDEFKLKSVVNAAMKRAREVGKPDLAAAVNEIYYQSIVNSRLTELLECILTQTATKAQTAEFQGYVRAAKRTLKEQDQAAKERKIPQSTTNASQPLSLLSPLPLRSPTKIIFEQGDTSASALPSTEVVEAAPPVPSLKLNNTPKNTSRRKSGQSHQMLKSPARERAGSANSDSSLTDMTSNPDDTEVEQVEAPVARTTTRVNGASGKDHAAERGSLAAPARGVKRTSAEADLQDDERKRAIESLAAKKQKLSENVVRDDTFQESNIRPAVRSQRQSTLRTSSKADGLAPPTLKLAPPSPVNVNTRGARGVSEDLDSPLSDLSAVSSRRSTPQVQQRPAKAFGKRAKTKQSPEKKHQAGHGGISGASGAGRESPIGDDDNEELSENEDFCSACGGSGFLLCCDGCDRSFHFSCLDPPLNDDASELNEPWYCYICVAKRPVTSDQTEKTTRGIFAPLLSGLRKCNPTNFQLPANIRDYFEGVATDAKGAFIEAVNVKTRNRPGYDELPDFTKQKDSKGNTIICYFCSKTSQGTRPIIPCDFCGENWHLDCLDPPLANPPARQHDGRKAHDWMCPLHADHELRKMDTSLLNSRTGRKVHIRRPRNAKVTETAVQRGFRNNGVVDIVDDESDTESEFYEEEDQNQSIVYKLPASGIKLDFIDKVKSTRIQAMRNEHAARRARVIAARAPRQLEQANFARRSFQEQQLALNLAQFAHSNKDMGLGSDQVENLVGTLIAEAPSEVVERIMAAEDAQKTQSVVPPSPPPTEEPGPLSEAQRKELMMLQALISRRLQGAAAKT